MYFIKIASKWHPHEWEIVGAFCVGKDQVDTEVLHRCKICGAVKIVELKGDWGMDQLVESKSPYDDAWLKSKKGEKEQIRRRTDDNKDIQER
jgi:hypothetical protein